MKKILFAIILLGSMVSFGYYQRKVQAQGDYSIFKGPYERINIIGDTSKMGNFDLALEYKNKDEGYMVYTSLNDNAFLHIHLAKTTDNGKTWKFVKRLVEAYEDSIVLGGKKYTGSIVNEVSTLVYVPDDIGKEWKLFWHKYFSAATPTIQKPKKRERILKYSWIMMKESDSAENLGKAEEVKLFSTNYTIEQGRYNFDDFVGGKTSPSAYTEPGSLYIDGVLYIALSWFGLPSNPDFAATFLIKSKDYGKTWEFVNKFMTQKDGLDFGYDHFTAVSLAEERGRVFLLASPIIKPNSHRGTYIFEFDDISRGKLKRSANGTLIISKIIKASVPVKYGDNSGESDYDKYNTFGGIIMPEADIRGFPLIARLYNTKQVIIDR